MRDARAHKGRRKPHRIMSGWHSLQSVGTLHSILQVAGLLFGAVSRATAGVVYHFWQRWDELVAITERLRASYGPVRWSSDSAMALHNGLVEFAILGVAAFLAVQYAASQYGARKDE